MAGETPSKWSQLLTEQRNPASARIDEVPALEALRIIHSEDRKAARAVETVLEDVARAVDIVVEAGALTQCNFGPYPENLSDSDTAKVGKPVDRK